jgi:hypothetical protein
MIKLTYKTKNRRKATAKQALPLVMAGVNEIVIFSAGTGRQGQRVGSGPAAGVTTPNALGCLY